MNEAIVKVRQWGNSMGVTIPKEIVEKEKLEPNDEVVIIVERKKSLRDIFGSLKEWKIDPQKTKDELRKEWNK